MTLAYRAHNDRGEGGHSDRHSETENNKRRKKCLPVTSFHRRHGEKNEARCRKQRSDDEWGPRAVASDESARPTGKKEHQQNERERGGAGRCCGVSLHLDKVQRKQEKENSKGGIEKQSKQVRAAETARRKKRMWDYW